MRDPSACHAAFDATAGKGCRMSTETTRARDTTAELACPDPGVGARRRASAFPRLADRAP